MDKWQFISLFCLFQGYFILKAMPEDSWGGPKIVLILWIASIFSFAFWVPTAFAF